MLRNHYVSWMSHLPAPPPFPAIAYDCGVRRVQVDHSERIYTASSRLRPRAFWQGVMHRSEQQGEGPDGEDSTKSCASTHAPKKSKKEIKGEAKSFIIS